MTPRTLKATIAAASLAGVGLLASGSADAQWGYNPGPSHFHAPYAAGSRYSLYQPSYGQTLGYQTAYPAYGQSSFYDPAAAAYGYGTSAVPTLAPRHSRTSIFGVYRPYGTPEVNYRLRRDGSLHVDVDD